MKNQAILSAKSLVTFLRFSLIGMFLWSALHMLYFIFIYLWPALISGKRQVVSLPIVFNHTQKGILTLPHVDYEYPVDIPVATGTFRAFGLPLKLFYLGSFGVLLNYICVLLIIYLIIKMLKNAREGSFLITKNAIRLRYIALLNIALILIDKLFILISSAYFSDKLEFPGLEFSTINGYSFSYWKYIFLFLFLLIIAEAFRLGAQLKEENDLTI